MAAKCGGGDCCSAINCSNSRKKCPDLSFFRFPKEVERCQKWVICCRRADFKGKSVEYLNKNCRLCTNHFEMNQFMNAETKNKLVWNAIPTLFSVPNPPKPIDCKRKLPHRMPPAKKVCQESAPQSPEHSSTTAPGFSEESSSTPDPTISGRIKQICAKNRSKVYRLKRKYTKLEKSLKKDNLTVGSLIDKTRDFLPPSQHMFFATQLKLASEGRKWKKWSNNEKQLALTIYYASPKAYNVLKQLFALPSVRCLQRCLEGINLKPGLNETIFEALRVKFAGLPVHKRLCSIVIDEMSLKGGLTFLSTEDYVEGFEDFGSCGTTSYVANHASVILVRGITLKWKQAIGYFTVCDSLNRIIQCDVIKEAISKLESIGLIVKTIVCDQGSNNKGMFKDLGVNADHPYFESATKVYGIFDPPHLLKCTRNNLVNHDIIVNNFPVKWQYIKDFYEYDSTLPVKAAHKLNDKHFNLTTFSKMRVNLAAQIFSASVGAGMLNLISLGKLPPEAIHTANFIIKMDQLFDTLNSKLCFGDNKFKSAISAKSKHISFLTDAIEWIQSWEVKSRKKNSTFTNWIVTIRSVIQLWLDISKNCNVKFLLTARLNQDCIENLFSVLRKRGGWADNPTPNQFRAHLKAVIVSSMMTPAKTGNCQVDVNKFLLELCHLKSTEAKKNLKNKVDISSSHSTLNSKGDTCLKVFDLPEKNIMSYVAGYISKVILKKHDCTVCKKIQSSFSTLTSDHEMFTMFKAKNEISGKDFGGLKTPTDEFLNCVLECEKQFLVVFDNMISGKNLHNRLVNLLEKNIDFKTLQICEETVKTFLNFFVRCRIFWAIRFMNRKLSTRQMTQRKNRKLIRIEHL